MKLPAVLLVISIVLHHFASAQIPPTFQIRHYTTENGLPSNGIKGIQWDEKTGFLWIATEAGIARFNGIDFKTYTNKNTSFIGSERFRFIIRNNKGIIYAADDHENIITVRQNELVLSRKTTKAIQQNTYGAYYALAVSDSFFRYKVNHPVIKPFFEDSDIPRSLPLTDTSVLFINNGNPVVITLTNNNPAPLAHQDVFIKTAFKIKDQVFLVSKNNEVFLVDVGAHLLLPVRFDEPFENEFNKGEFHFFWDASEKSSIVTRDNKAWILSYNGTMIMARQICDALPPGILILYDQYSEEKKLLFIGTDAKGLFVITQNRVNVVRKKQDAMAGTNAYYSQIELPGNRILTDVGDVLGPPQKLNQPVKDKFYNAYLTSDSLLWYNKRSNGFYLYCYNYKTGLTKEYNKIPIHQHFGLANSNGKIYIANNEGLGMLQNDSLHYFFNFKDHAIDPYCMAELSPGIFAVSFCHLLRFNTITGVMDTLLPASGDCIRALWKYKDYFFIGTYGKGYYIYRNGKMKAMALDKDNFLSYVHGFIADEYGYCWMSTNRGLFKSRLADLLNAFEHNGDKVYYHYFGRNDGMDITEMNGSFAPPVLQMQNETISFPTMDGLLWVNPGKAVPILPYGNIYVDEILVDNEKMNAGSLTTEPFPSDTREILIQLGFSAWCNKENLYIDYDLNNSGKWKAVDVGNEAVIRLYSLGPGNYNLRVRKMNGFGSENYSYNEFHFHITTPWYQRWWFYLLLSFLIVGLGSLYVKLRTRQYVIRQRKLEQQVFEKTKELQLKNEILEKNDTVKTRLISIISHDIITPLKFLTVAGKNLAQKKQMMPEEMQNEAINEMTKTSQELQLLTTNILNWIMYQNQNRRMVMENINLHEQVERIFGILNPLAHQKQQHLLNNIDEQLIVFQYAGPLRVLIYNLVMNAINFSGKGNISVSDRRENDNVIISIQDEGAGMTPEQIQNIMNDEVIISSTTVDNRKGHGLGYLIIKDLIKMIGAELIIVSEKEKGTIVSIKIPSG